MTNPFTFDALLGLLHQRNAPLPDHRTGGMGKTVMAMALSAAFARAGRVAESRTFFSTGEQILSEVGDRQQLGLLLCFRSQAAALAEATGTGAESELGREVAELRDILAVTEKPP